VNVVAKDPDAPMMFTGGMMRDRVDDDWTFELRAVQSPALLRTFRAPAGYSLKAVLLNGTDVTDTGIAFKPGEPVTGLQVVLSTTSSGVTGGVTDDGGKPVADYAVVIFSEDPAKWGFMSRHVTMARPDQQGGFQAKNLPAGRYLAVAVEALEDGQESDPEFLERLRSLATAFTLGEGEQRSVSLKIVQAY
jgi:Carboxypeptidase regulatory-like domain